MAILGPHGRVVQHVNYMSDRTLPGGTWLGKNPLAYFVGWIP